MAYAKVVDGILVEAPRNYKLEDGAIICNFNNDITTMEKHGFKEIKKSIPEFDPEVEIVVFDTVEDKEDCVLITYRKDDEKWQDLAQITPVLRQRERTRVWFLAS